MSNVLPTLTITGWIFDKNIIIKKVLEYFITSDYSQSILYYGKISSLKYLLKEYQNDIPNLINETKNTLETLYKRYFKEVEVTVDIDTSVTPAIMYLNIVCYDDDGNKYTLSESYSMTTDILKSVDDKIIR